MLGFFSVYFSLTDAMQVNASGVSIFLLAQNRYIRLCGFDMSALADSI